MSELARVRVPGVARCVHEIRVHMKGNIMTLWRNNATVTLAPLSGGPYETREFQASSLPAAHDIINWRLDREWSGYMAISVVFVETS